MAKWTIVALALIGCAVAEPPSGYSYAPASIGYSSGGLSQGGHYTPVPVGHQTSEGYNVDPHLLEKIKHIILKDEIQNEAYQGASHGSHGISHGVSSHYGAPAPVYGVPYERIVGIELGHIQQGLQVAQYHQAEEDYSSGYAGGYSGYSGISGGQGGYSSGGHGGYSSGGQGGYSSGGYSSGGYSSGGHASVSYSAPSVAYSAPVSYSTIGAPSGSYGVPSVSSSYGAPHH